MVYRPIISILLLMALSTTSCFAGPRDTPAYRLDVTVDLEGRLVGGTVFITDVTRSPLRLISGKTSTIDRVEMDGALMEFSINTSPNGGRKEIDIPFSLDIDTEKGRTSKTIKVSFHTTFPDISAAREGIRRGVAYVADGVIGKEGAYLPASSFWFPWAKDTLSLFDVTVRTPAGFDAVMEGRWLGREESAGGTVNRWKTDKPVEGVNLMVGRYKVDSERHRGVDIYTFLFTKDKELSNLYIEKVKWYLDLYRELFPPYPFEKFAVVESFLPTGYGMPSYTLLGSDIIRLPFIPDTSLGHEIAHSWWGNSVLPDTRHGNWAEALTTYTADHLYAARKGSEEGRRYRKKMLINYKSYAGEEAIPLAAFLDATKPSSRAVGYNKGAMVFHMLRRLLGDDLFYSGLREFFKNNAFKRASWIDIKRAFERVSGRGLGWFFTQWLERSGGPEITLEWAKQVSKDDEHSIILKLSQKTPPYMLDLPIRIETPGGGELWERIRLDGKEKEVELVVGKEALSVEVDPNFDNFRILSHEEVPPSLAGFFGDRAGAVIVPGGKEGGARYRPLIHSLVKDYGLQSIPDDKASLQYIKERSVLIVGGPVENLLFSSIAKYLPKGFEIEPGRIIVNGRSYRPDGTVAVLAIKNPYDVEKTICLIAGGLDREEMARIARRIPHLTSKGYLVFQGGGRLERGTFDGTKVLRHEFAGVATGSGPITHGGE